MEKRWWKGNELKEKNLDIIELVQKGLQPHDENGNKIAPPDLAKVFNRFYEVKAYIESIEQKFPGIQNANYRDWRVLNRNRQVDWDGRLEKISFPDGSDSEIREGYETAKAEFEYLEPIIKQYPNPPSWKGYKRPEKPKDINFVENLLLSSYYKSEDCLTFATLQRSESHPDYKNIPKKRPSQEAKEKAIKMAKEYLDKHRSQRKKPDIKDAIQRIQAKVVKNKYKDRTIDDWIREYFPKESRMPGRPKKK
jgi:hypothetical protein